MSNCMERSDAQLGSLCHLTPFDCEVDELVLALLKGLTLLLPKARQPTAIAAPDIATPIGENNRADHHQRGVGWRDSPRLQLRRQSETAIFRREDASTAFEIAIGDPVTIAPSTGRPF